MHSPDIIVLNGEEDETMGICSEERFRGKESFGFGHPVFRWWIERGGGGGGFPRSAICVDVKFVVIAVVLRKAWYVTTCWRGMVSGLGEVLLVVRKIRCAAKSWCRRSRFVGG